MVSAHPGGGQRPISLEYQIYLPAIDTIVTGMCRGGMKMRLIGALVVDEAVMMTGVGAQEGPRQRTEACRLGTRMSTMT